ncbi:hypothetical protein BCD49_07900 [Pseudofrankia sp. EUN1h]|nr:hypothetical protein BCD49_07900 [Pseudofrankia sp. EUN1h]
MEFWKVLEFLKFLKFLEVLERAEGGTGGKRWACGVLTRVDGLANTMTIGGIWRRQRGGRLSDSDR